MNWSCVGMSSLRLGTRARDHLNLVDNNTKNAINDHLYNCDKCSFTKHSAESFKVLKQCVTGSDTKIQETLLGKG